MRWTSLIVMVGAVLVLAPRLATLFGATDQKVAAVATALVVTLGQALVVHWMATTSRHRWKLLVLWTAAVFSTTFLGAVAIATKVSDKPLVKVLSPGVLDGEELVHYHRILVFGAISTLVCELMVAGAAIVYAGSVQVDCDLMQACEEAIGLGTKWHAAQDEAERLKVENQTLLARLEAANGLVPPASTRRRRPSSVSIGSLVERPCRYGCGWKTEPMPEASARRSEGLHAGRYCQGRPSTTAAENGGKKGVRP